MSSKLSIIQTRHDEKSTLSTSIEVHQTGRQDQLGTTAELKYLGKQEVEEGRENVKFEEKSLQINENDFLKHDDRQKYITVEDHHVHRTSPVTSNSTSKSSRSRIGRATSLGRFSRHVFCALIQLVHSSSSSTSTSNEGIRNGNGHGSGGSSYENDDNEDNTNDKYDISCNDQHKSRINNSSQPRRKSYQVVADEIGRKLSLMSQEQSTATTLGGDCCLALISSSTSTSRSMQKSPHFTQARKRKSLINDDNNDNDDDLDRSKIAKDNPVSNKNQQTKIQTNGRTKNRSNDSSRHRQSYRQCKSWIKDSRNKIMNIKLNQKNASVDSSHLIDTTSNTNHHHQSFNNQATTRNILNHRNDNLDDLILLQAKFEKVKLGSSLDSATQQSYNSQADRSSFDKLERLTGNKQPSFLAQSSIQSGQSRNSSQLDQDQNIGVMTSGHSINNLSRLSGSGSGSTTVRNSSSTLILRNQNQQQQQYSGTAPTSTHNSPNRHSDGASNRQTFQLKGQLSDRMRELLDLLDEIGEKLSPKLHDADTYTNQSLPFDHNFDSSLYLEDNWSIFVDLSSEIEQHQHQHQKINQSTSLDNPNVHQPTGVSIMQEDPDQSTKQYLANIMVQQDTIWELIKTENSYIKCLKQMIDVFLFTLSELQQHSFLLDIDKTRLTSNVEEIYEANYKFWFNYLLPMLQESRSSRKPLNPSLINNGFNRWCESRMDCDRLRLMDLLAKPTQRITRYSLLLKSILRRCISKSQIDHLKDMIAHMDRFVLTVDLEMRRREELERLIEIDSLFDCHQMYSTSSYNNEEIDQLLQIHSRPVRLLEPLFKCSHQCQRQLLFDSSSNQPLSGAGGFSGTQIGSGAFGTVSSTGSGTNYHSGVHHPSEFNASSVSSSSSSNKRLSPKHDHNQHHNHHHQSSSKQFQPYYGQFKFRDPSLNNKIDVTLLLFTDQLLICKQVSGSSISHHQHQSSSATTAGYNSSTRLMNQSQLHQQARQFSHDGYTGTVGQHQQAKHLVRHAQTSQSQSLTNTTTNLACLNTRNRCNSSSTTTTTTTLATNNNSNQQQQQQQSAQRSCISRSRAGSPDYTPSSAQVGVGHQSRSLTGTIVDGDMAAVAAIACKQRSLALGSLSIGNAIELSASRAVSCILAPSGCLNLTSSSNQKTTTTTGNTSQMGRSNGGGSGSGSAIDVMLQQDPPLDFDQQQQQRHEPLGSASECNDQATTTTTKSASVLRLHQQHYRTLSSNYNNITTTNNSAGSINSSVSSLSARDGGGGGPSGSGTAALSVIGPTSPPLHQNPATASSSSSTSHLPAFLQRGMNSFKRSSGIGEKRTQADQAGVASTQQSRNASSGSTEKASCEQHQLEQRTSNLSGYFSQLHNYYSSINTSSSNASGPHNHHHIHSNNNNNDSNSICKQNTTTTGFGRLVPSSMAATTTTTTRPYKLRLIRSPYPIDKLTMIELKDLRSVLFILRGDDMSVLSSFIIYLPSGFGAASFVGSANQSMSSNLIGVGGVDASGSGSGSGATTTTTSDSTTLGKPDSTTSSSSISGLIGGGGGVTSCGGALFAGSSRSPASQLISLIQEAQIKLKVAKEFHAIVLENDNNDNNNNDDRLEEPVDDDHDEDHECKHQPRDTLIDNNNLNNRQLEQPLTLSKNQSSFVDKNAACKPPTGLIGCDDRDDLTTTNYIDDRTMICVNCHNENQINLGLPMIENYDQNSLSAMLLIIAAKNRHRKRWSFGGESNSSILQNAIALSATGSDYKDASNDLTNRQHNQLQNHKEASSSKIASLHHQDTHSSFRDYKPAVTTSTRAVSLSCQNSFCCRQQQNHHDHATPNKNNDVDGVARVGQNIHDNEANCLDLNWLRARSELVASQWSQQMQKSLVELYRSMLLGHARFDDLLWEDRNCLAFVEDLIQHQSNDRPIASSIDLQDETKINHNATHQRHCSSFRSALTEHHRNNNKNNNLSFIRKHNNNASSDHALCYPPSYMMEKHGEKQQQEVSPICTMDSSPSNRHRLHSMVTTNTHHQHYLPRSYGPFSNGARANRASFRMAVSTSETSKKIADPYAKPANNNISSSSVCSGVEMAIDDHSGDLLVSRSMSLATSNHISPLAAILDLETKREGSTNDIPFVQVDLQRPKPVVTSEQQQQPLNPVTSPIVVLKERDNLLLQKFTPSNRLLSSSTTDIECNHHIDLGLADENILLTESNVQLDSNGLTQTRGSNLRRPRVSSLRRQNVVFNQSFCQQNQSSSVQQQHNKATTTADISEPDSLTDAISVNKPSSLGNGSTNDEQIHQKPTSQQQHSIVHSQLNSSSFELGQLHSIHPRNGKFNQNYPRSISVETTKKLTRSSGAFVSVYLTSPHQEDSIQLMASTSMDQDKKQRHMSNRRSSSSRYLNIPRNS